MAIKLKRGLKAGLPPLQQGEPAFTTDTKELFIGDGTDNILINKDVYTKTEVDNELALKVDKTTTVNGKELSTDIEIGVGDIAGLETTINTKADKTYVDSQDALKVDKNANITGATKTKITYDSKGLVTAGADLVESDIPTLSPSKITQDENNRFVSDTEKSTWNNKVDKIEGKGLTKNELTDDLKGKYDTAYSHSQSTHAPSNAQVNVIETVKVNGVALPVSSKTVDITIPDVDLTNYYNKTQTETLINDAILGLLGGES